MTRESSATARGARPTLAEAAGLNWQAATFRSRYGDVLTWTQNRKLKYIFWFFSVFGRFSAKVGPKNLPNAPGLKNAT